MLDEAVADVGHLDVDGHKAGDEGILEDKQDEVADEAGHVDHIDVKPLVDVDGRGAGGGTEIHYGWNCIAELGCLLRRRGQQRSDE